MGLLSALNLPDPAQLESMAETAVKIVTGQYFIPVFDDSGTSPFAPLAIFAGEEVMVPVAIKNIAIAPKGAAIKWKVDSSGNLAVDVDADSGKAALTIKAAKIGPGYVRPQIAVAMGGKTFQFDGPVIFVNVMAKAADSGQAVADGGGETSATVLEQDMATFLQPWLTASLDGIDQFVANQLNSQVEGMSQGSWTSFVEGVLGNGIWAATCFFPIGTASLLIFTVAAGGIAVASVPSIPSDGETHIPEVRKYMRDYIFSAFTSLNGGLRNMALAILKAHPAIKRYEALSLFAKASMVPGTVRIDSSFKSKPQLNLSAIASKMEKAAKDVLDLILEKEKADKAKRSLEISQNLMRHRH